MEHANWPTVAVFGRELSGHRETPRCVNEAGERKSNVSQKGTRLWVIDVVPCLPSHVTPCVRDCTLVTLGQEACLCPPIGTVQLLSCANVFSWACHGVPVDVRGVNFDLVALACLSCVSQIFHWLRLDSTAGRYGWYPKGTSQIWRRSRHRQKNCVVVALAAHVGT